MRRYRRPARSPGSGHITFGLLAACCAVLTIVPCGCASYQMGTRSLFRPEVRTVYVPMFESESFRRNLGERLTEAVIKEIEAQTPYKVVQSADADSVLTGRIVSERKRVVARDDNNQPRDVETELGVEVSWFDRRGRILQNASLPFTPLALSVTQGANLIPEGGQSLATAHQEAIQRLARQIVWQMETRW